MTLPQQLSIFDAIEAPSALWTPDEIFDWLNGDMVPKLSEDRRIRRKPAQCAGDQIGEYVSVWANTAPQGGIILLGVANDGSIEGLERVGERINEIEKAPSIFAPEARSWVSQVCYCLG